MKKKTDNRDKDPETSKMNADSEKDFPGYPHYPANEDILRQKNAEKVDADIENLNRSFKDIPQLKKDPVNPTGEINELPVPEDLLDEPEEEKSESDLTSDDYIALGTKGGDMDMGEDEEFKKSRVYPIDMAGSDLDIPGAELDDENENIGEEDEENNFYSLKTD